MEAVLTIISSLLAIATVVEFLWYGGRLPGFIHSLVGRVSWGSLQTALSGLMRQIRSSGWQPDLVIGMGRTGGLVAALLAENMRWLPPEVGLTVLNFRQAPTDEDKAEVDALVQEAGAVQAERILIVDSETYRGDAIRMVVTALRELGPEGLDVRTATLFKFEPKGYQLSRPKPNFEGTRLGRPVLMPWVLAPELRLAAKKVQSERWRRR
ncbi:MAG TPA: phosphoribosyltransferase [Dehalococcoidia bacterium]|nr:phosphoribosyltransferase [Dehalococcoidia bacterium]